MNLKPYLILLSAFLFISACSQLPTLPADTQQSANAIPSQWHISAKMGIRSPSNSGSVTLDWQQQEDEYHIRASGPLGQGSGLLSGNQNTITITRPNKTDITSNDPEQLIKDALGWTLPLTHLQYWARGLADPNIALAEQTFNADGSLSLLQQSGWSIRYTRHMMAEQWLMPAKVRATKDDVTITLVIKQWIF